MTRPSNPRLRAVDHDIETLDLARRVMPQALDVMRSARRGYPGSGLGSSGRGSGGSPVEAAAMRPDLGGAAITELDAALRQLHSAAEAIYRLASGWAPSAPSPKAQRETEAANVAECFSCRSHGHHAPMHVHTDAGGVLPDPMALCRWCRDWARSQGRLPTAAETNRHHKGLRVMVSA